MPSVFPEHPARVVVHLECFRLSPRPVEREHQVRAQLLAQRVLTHELLELTDQLPVLAEQEIGLDPTFERSQPQLLQARDRRLGERLVE